MTATKKKVGRPERTKQSYANQVSNQKARIERLERKVAISEEIIEVMVEQLDRYQAASLPERIKYVITKEL